MGDVGQQIPDAPQPPTAPRYAVTGPASRGFRAFANEIEWLLYDLRLRIWRWVYFEEAEFIGGALDGQRWRVPRDAKTWDLLHRDGLDHYRRKRRISGTYFICNAPAASERSGAGQPS